MCRHYPLLACAIVGPVACGSNQPDASGSGTIEVALQDGGAATRSAHITATNDGTGAVAASEDVAIDSVVTIMLRVPAGHYTLAIDGFTDAGHQHRVASGEGQVAVDAHGASFVKVAIIAGGGLMIGIDSGPVIDSVDVTENGAGDFQLTVNAHDPDGDVLSYFWMGAGINGPEPSDATMTLAATTLAQLHGRPTVIIVVQDTAGSAALAIVKLPAPGKCQLCGTLVTKVIGPGDGDDEGENEENVDPQGIDREGAMACLTAHVACVGSCMVDASSGQTDAHCVSTCGLDLASCLGNAEDGDEVEGN